MPVAVLPTRPGTASTGARYSSIARVRGVWLLLIAAAAGVLTGLAYQPNGVWPLLLVGVPALTLVVRGVPPRRGFAIGYVYGVALLATTISWVHVLGVWVAALLVLFEALWFGILGVALNLTGRLRLWPLAAACCWVLVEFGYSRVPFGGFGWVRLAYAAVDTPLAGWLPIIGVPGVSLLVAACGQAVAYGVWRLARRTRPVRSVLTAVIALGLMVLGGTVIRFLPTGGAAATQSLEVGIVQGNVPGKGIEALGRMRSVTNNHLSETIDLMAKSRLGLQAMPDFILWPENSTDIDPTRDPITGATVQAAATLAGVPIMVGAVMSGPGADERQTAALWWDPTRGILARYNKQNLVPFGEWIPLRSQLLPLVPILKEVGAQSVPGTEPGVLRVPVAGREVAVGDIICFELAYDRTVYSTIDNGAQVLMVQSNNATYGGTGQIEQQFAITRARAMETRREIAVATTNSVSGYIDSDGQVVWRSQEFTAASNVVSMPIRDNRTLALTVAPWLDRGAALAGFGCCLYALIRGRRRRSGPSTSTTEVPA